MTIQKNNLEKNQLRQCRICNQIWQTHENGKILFTCPNCGSKSRRHIDMAIYGNRLYISHILTQKAYNELIFGTERGRTWHTEFGKIKGIWIEKHLGVIQKQLKDK